MQFAIHSGVIAYPKLVMLYGLNPDDCIRWDEHDPVTFKGRIESNYIHFSTRQFGDYKEYLNKLLGITEEAGGRIWE
jgi:hypothetical protein